MGEHRLPSEQLARPMRDRYSGRPAPGPIGTPIEAGPAQPPRRPSGRRHRWGRRIRTALRSKQGRWALIALACVVVVVIGLLSQGFLSSAAPSVNVPDALGGTSPSPSASLPISPGPSASKSKATASGQPGNVLQTLKDRFPSDNPLNHLHGPGAHKVVVSASSSEPIAVVGYLVPTGLSSPYDTVKPNARHWSFTEQAVGKGYLAAVFVQAGRSGAPVTCTISVDGTVTNSETTSGGYGRTVCLG
jgi:hypothetical protein